MKIFGKIIRLNLPLCFLLILASLEFVLLLRHKSPYVSDSYMYTHIFYEMQGDSFDTAYQKIKNKVDVNKLSDIEKKIFFDADTYKYSFSRYQRRPLYPFLAYVLNLFVNNEYLAFLVPVFLSYLGVITLVFLLFRMRFDLWWTSLGTALFTGFYPFLDWSTYFLTDTIGAFFWILQIYVMIKFIKNPKRSTLVSYVLLLLISLLNREQSLIIFVAVLAAYLVGIVFKFPKSNLFSLRKLFIVSFAVAAIYLLLNKIFNGPSLYDSWIYWQSDFGYKTTKYLPMETVQFLGQKLVEAHVGLVKDLVHYRWWAIFTILGFIGLWQLFIVRKKPQLVDIILLGSSAAAYFGLLLIPYLTYRYFFPAIIGIAYFSVYALSSYFQTHK